MEIFDLNAKEIENTSAIKNYNITFEKNFKVRYNSYLEKNIDKKAQIFLCLAFKRKRCVLTSMVTEAY